MLWKWPRRKKPSLTPIHKYLNWEAQDMVILFCIWNFCCCIGFFYFKFPKSLTIYAMLSKNSFLGLHGVREMEVTSGEWVCTLDGSSKMAVGQASRRLKKCDVKPTLQIWFLSPFEISIKKVEGVMKCRCYLKVKSNNIDTLIQCGICFMHIQIITVCYWALHKKWSFLFRISSLG